jgi:hypothetical protein
MRLNTTYSPSCQYELVPVDYVSSCCSPRVAPCVCLGYSKLVPLHFTYVIYMIRVPTKKGENILDFIRLLLSLGLVFPT